jgi:NhaA family Na+:H+ antiporter
MKSEVLNKRMLVPAYQFARRSSAGGIVLMITTLVALILANSPLSSTISALWAIPITFSIGDFILSKPMIYWINDGLMSLFFFVIGLELKREILTGELSKPSNAILPIIAGIGGMVVPALIYLYFNYGASDEASKGWGIPMATDIAFTLGIVYLLGSRVPLALKVFLTALAIIDDIGAVLVIALFYTAEISTFHLLVGFGFLGLMILGNITGVRSVLFYAILGVGGLWVAFLLSGVHATIAAVLAAFAIPASIKIGKKDYGQQLQALVGRFRKIQANQVHFATYKEQKIIDKIEQRTSDVMPPLQKLEHSMHPLVAFLVIPIFAFANTGITFTSDFFTLLGGSVAMGVLFGLLLGKVIGIVGIVFVCQKLGWVKIPSPLNYTYITGAAFLAAIGFTMSLFITNLAFVESNYIYQSKLGILAASFIAGIVGYILLRRAITTQSIIHTEKTPKTNPFNSLTEQKV